MHNEEMKIKKEIKINIPIMFVLGIIFLICGIILLVDGVTIRKNLKNIHGGNVELSTLKEGEYIRVDKVKTLGGIQSGMTNFCIHGYCYIGLLEYNYYMININDKDNNYISVMIVQNQFGDLNEYTDKEGYITLSEKYDIFNDSFDFKVVKADNRHQYNVKEAKNIINLYIDKEEVQLYSKVALVPVNFENERKVLVQSQCVLLTAFILIFASKPWKILQINYIQEKG